jgi:DNA-binding transcriptional regulator GbsR (MarR family)
MMTTTEAVRQELNRWAPGDKKHAYDIHQDVLSILRSHGVWKRPLDGTVMRRVREMADMYRIRTLKPGESLYIKDVQNDKA